MDEYDALAWALDRVFQGTNVKVVTAREVGLNVERVEPVERVVDVAWDEEEEAQYRMRHQS